MGLYGVTASVIVLFLAAVLIYNRLVRLRNLVKEGWSGIDVQLKRRASLIPNLVETVRGYMGHERSLLSEITELRSKSLETQKIGDKGRDRDGPEQIPGQSHGRGRKLSRPQGQSELSRPCRRTLPRSRTRSRWRGATTTARCATSISPSNPFQAISWPGCSPSSRPSFSPSTMPRSGRFPRYASAAQS